MNLPSLRRKREPQRSETVIGFDEWASMIMQFGFNGVQYSIPGVPQEEVVAGSFRSLAATGYKSNGVVFACMGARMSLFSEARFKYRQLRDGRPGNLFGKPGLAPLEQPAAGQTTGDMLARAIQDADLGGNWFGVRRGAGVRRLRPDWVSLIIGSDTDAEVLPWDVDSEVVGYKYQPGGPGSGREPEFFLAEEVAHFAPKPDPEAQFRGMSWLTPIVREVMADKAATDHKLRFFEQGATPNLVVKMNVEDVTKFREWTRLFKEDHEGAANAYKTMFLGAGMDATVVGANMEQLEFKVTQGAGETRIAAAAGVPPVIVGLSEGLAAATYSNYGQARRAFADLTMRPLWRNMAGSLARIITAEPNAELWYDDRDISFLQEDQKDAAEVVQFKASAIKQLVDAGYEPSSVVDAVDSYDLSGRLTHTGLVSVQLQPPGTPAPRDPALNGSVPARSQQLLPAGTQED